MPDFRTALRKSFVTRRAKSRKSTNNSVTINKNWARLRTRPSFLRRMKTAKLSARIPKYGRCSHLHTRIFRLMTSVLSRNQHCDHPCKDFRSWQWEPQSEFGERPCLRNQKPR